MTDQIHSRQEMCCAPCPEAPDGRRLIRKNPENPLLCMKRRYYGTAARVTFRHLLRNYTPLQRKPILLPSYIGESVREGSGVHDPLEECGIPVDFYRVGSRLEPDLSDLESKVRSQAFGAVFVIHYFGICQSPIGRIANLCRQEGLYLIEDCAHCLNSKCDDGTLGSFGDFSLYSVHKILPVQNGGILEVLRPEVSLPPLPSDERMSLDTLSVLSSADLESISSKRKENYRVLNHLLSNAQGVEPLYPELPSGSTPMNYPFLLTLHSRHDVYTELVRRGVEPVALYYKLIPAIERELYPVSYSISERILNLPVHQDLSASDMARMAGELVELLNTLPRTNPMKAFE